MSFPRRRIARSGKVSFRRAITSRRRGPHEGFDIWARKRARGDFRKLPRPVSGAQASAGRARDRKRRFGLLHGYMLADKGLPTCFVYAGRFPLRRRRGRKAVRPGGLEKRWCAVVCSGIAWQIRCRVRPDNKDKRLCLSRLNPNSPDRAPACRGGHAPLFASAWSGQIRCRVRGRTFFCCGLPSGNPMPCPACRKGGARLIVTAYLRANRALPGWMKTLRFRDAAWFAGGPWRVRSGLRQRAFGARRRRGKRPPPCRIRSR